MKEHDFSRAERGKFFRKRPKLSLPIHLDEEVQDYFRERAQQKGRVALAGPEVLADAAHAVLTRPAREHTGNLYLDDEVLAEEGITDLDRYAVAPGTPLYPDFFVEPAQGPAALRLERSEGRGPSLFPVREIGELSFELLRGYLAEELE